MKPQGPFLTLVSGLVLTAVLGVLSVSTAPEADTVAVAEGEPAAAARTGAAVPGPTVTAQTVPGPTGTAEAEPADTTPKRADYAGVAQGNGGLVAVSIKNGKAVAYFCDGRVEAWLKGTAENNTVTLTGKNDSLITAALGDGKAQGKLQVGKGKWRFTAPLVKKPSGLYRAVATVRGARLVGGWIVLPSGRQVGLVAADGSSSRAPELTPGSPVTVDGAELRPEDTDAFIDRF
ncbi:hypothetical protein [Sphaerisporangium sp. TRM90804]|uniref:hypothetical protein n=1 Tax=Sphaerisporangium sp. TRM90804 TaxID=3031113 RepID=UPI00244D60EF|nr:hypothetical protein [Sphaerisporangium sp. TRM90804]MDH2429850.1 hypothetical protein [Sphaerisporangium sp. TRM90804]